MRKGIDWSINLLGAIVLVVMSAALIGPTLINPVKAKDTETQPTSETVCKTADNCIDNLDGARCMVIYPDDSSPFCGCLKNEDCLNRRSGICGSNSRCI